MVDGGDDAVEAAYHGHGGGGLGDGFSGGCGDEAGGAKEDSQDSGAYAGTNFGGKACYGAGGTLQTGHSFPFVKVGQVHDDEGLEVADRKSSKTGCHKGNHQHGHTASGEEIQDIAGNSESGSHAYQPGYGDSVH